MILTYTSAETKNKKTELNRLVRNGLIPKVENKMTHENTYMFNDKLREALLNSIEINTISEYDKEQKAYTCYNSLIPHIYGEGETHAEAEAAMVSEAIELVSEIAEDPSIFNGVLNGIQQFVLANIALVSNDILQVKRILKVG